ncbi:Gaa1-domain-containing protein [Mycena rosella]|uniref:Gaa1-domain-containing protein n=1 Tax=Mycena rosella TaxID=1033263 RepID=A0AAD7MBT5_MYCRO|nr:Gaa1-domain-containing protein [Mycena rosella]
MDRIRARLRAILRPPGDPNLNRVQRRRAIISALTRRLHLIKFILFLVGYLWMAAIPSPRLGRGTYIDENALQPGQVNTYWNWGDVANADRYLGQLEGLRDANSTSEQRAKILMNEFIKLGMSASTQGYVFTSSTGKVKGTNAYAVLSSPRTSGTEAMVISASWISRAGEGDGTLNLRGIATVLTLANFLKSYSLWAKDIIFVVSDNYVDGMQAWLNAYHGSTQSNLQADDLELTSGVIWTALNIDYPGHSFSHLGIFHEGINGRLPNQDLLNSFHHISKWTGGVPVLVYDHLEPQNDLPSWIPSAYHEEIRGYSYRSKNVLRHIGYQARGRGSGVHGLFHQFRIDAFTMFGVPAAGPHGFHAIGRIIESTLRTTNNLLERLHASFFFYILTAPERFLKIGSFLPSAVLISVAMMFGGLRVWSDSAWILDIFVHPEKTEADTGPTSNKWIQRSRPVIPVLGIVLSTHILGGVLFSVLTTSWFSNNQTVASVVLFLAVFVTQLSALLAPSQDEKTTAPASQLLKALNLCFASTVISITTVVNFSLAMSLAILLGIPLSISSPSRSLPLRLGSFALYSGLGLGWIFAREELQKAIWDWEILGVWFAPFVCVVYLPLVLQAGLVCLLPV